MLSNFDFVTESFTLIAGNRSSPVCCISYSRCTPVVVSSVTPLMPSPILVQRCGSSCRERWSTRRMTPNSSEAAPSGSGTAPARSNSAPLCTSSVASPPSSRIMFGPLPSGQRSVCSMHHQYSSSDSPFQAYTGTPFGSSGVPSGPTTAAAAAWSWVEKMLQLAQRTSAPSDVSVSISTAVWIVMWSEPVIRAPLSGCSAAYFSRRDMRPGISCCASSISLRPYSARERSATLKSVLAAVVVVICPPLRGSVRSVSSGGVGQRQQALVLLLLPAQPVAGTHALWALCRRLEPGIDRLAHPLVLAQPLGERHVGEGALEPGQQLAQCAQALQLARSEDAVARVGPVRLDQPDALEVAEHSRRPAGRLSRFVDGQAVGHRSIGGNLSTIVSRFGGGEILAQALAENPFRGGLELGLLPAREAGEGGCGGLELGLQLGRGDDHRGDGEVDDRGPRIAETGRDA